MGGASKEATIIKKVKEQVGIIQIQLHSHGTDIQEIKSTVDSLLQGQDEMRQTLDDQKSTMDKVLERLDVFGGGPTWGGNQTGSHSGIITPTGTSLNNKK